MPAPLIVVDTTVFVNAATSRPGSLAKRVVEAIQTEEARLAVSDAALDELKGIMYRPSVEPYVRRPGWAFEIGLVPGFMGRHHHPGVYDWPSLSDRKDWWVLDPAFASGADFIITWDGDLLDLDPSLGFEVIQPPELLRRLSEG